MNSSQVQIRVSSTSKRPVCKNSSTSTSQNTPRRFLSYPKSRCMQLGPVWSSVLYQLEELGQCAPIALLAFFQQETHISRPSTEACPCHFVSDDEDGVRGSPRARRKEGDPAHPGFVDHRSAVLRAAGRAAAAGQTQRAAPSAAGRGLSSKLPPRPGDPPVKAPYTPAGGSASQPSGAGAATNAAGGSASGGSARQVPPSGAGSAPLRGSASVPGGGSANDGGARGAPLAMPRPGVGNPGPTAANVGQRSQPLGSGSAGRGLGSAVSAFYNKSLVTEAPPRPPLHNPRPANGVPGGAGAKPASQGPPKNHAGDLAALVRSKNTPKNALSDVYSFPEDAPEPVSRWSAGVAGNGVPANGRHGAGNLGLGPPSGGPAAAGPHAGPGRDNPGENTARDPRPQQYATAGGGRGGANGVGAREAAGRSTAWDPRRQPFAAPVGGHGTSSGNAHRQAPATAVVRAPGFERGGGGNNSPPRDPRRQPPGNSAAGDIGNAGGTDPRQPPTAAGNGYGSAGGEFGGVRGPPPGVRVSQAPDADAGSGLLEQYRTGFMPGQNQGTHSDVLIIAEVPWYETVVHF